MQFAEWLSKNYQWLFDGIGGAALLAMVAWGLRKLFAKRRNAALPQSQTSVQTAQPKGSPQGGQSQLSGANSINIQAGDNISIGNITAPSKKS